MNFDLSSTQLTLQQNFQTFGDMLGQRIASSEVVGGSVTQLFDTGIWQTCCDAGLLSILLPVDRRSSRTPDYTLNLPDEPLSILDAVIAMEGFGQGCHSNALAFALNTHLWTVQHTIQSYGNEKQKGDLLKRLSNGELIGCHAMTEPDIGSDPASMKTTATRAANGFVLNGCKCFISLAPVSDIIVVFASTNPDKAKWGISCFIVNRHSQGITVSEPTEKMGLEAVPMGTITFDDCHVPESALLGSEGAGIGIANASLEYERCCLLASQIGRMQTQLASSIHYARNRIQSGQSIGRFQSISNRIADMKVRLETARLLLYKVASLKSRGEPAMMESAMLKLLVSEHFLQSSMDAMRIHGGLGYIRDGGVEHDVRDSLGGVLYAGTSDIQRNVIAGMLGL